MALIEKITEDMKAAMKAGERDRVAALRMLRAAIKDREIELGHALGDAEVQQVLGRIVKQRKDAARQYAEAGREDLAAKELQEAEWMQAYLPEPLDEAALEQLVRQVVAELGASGMKDMGRVMAEVKARAAGRADMAKASSLVRGALSA